MQVDKEGKAAHQYPDLEINILTSTVNPLRTCHIPITHNLYRKQLNTFCISTFTYEAAGAFSHDLSAPSISVVEGLAASSGVSDTSWVEPSRPLSAFKVRNSSWSSEKQGQRVRPSSGALFPHYLALEIRDGEYSTNTTPLVIVVWAYSMEIISKNWELQRSSQESISNSYKFVFPTYITYSRLFCVFTSLSCCRKSNSQYDIKYYLLML